MKPAGKHGFARRLLYIICTFIGHPNTYIYTSQGDSPDVEGVDDAYELETTREAFLLLGMWIFYIIIFLSA